MDEPAPNNETSMPRSILGVALALLVFATVWVVASVLFTLFDHVRGLGNDKLQAVFREVVVPGFAGFTAMQAVRYWIEAASLRFVFFAFAATVFILIGAYLGLVGPTAGRIGVGAWDILLAISTLSAGIIGAYLVVKEKL